MIYIQWTQKHLESFINIKIWNHTQGTLSIPHCIVYGERIMQDEFASLPVGNKRFLHQGIDANSDSRVFTKYLFLLLLRYNLNQRTQKTFRIFYQQGNADPRTRGLIQIPQKVLRKTKAKAKCCFLVISGHHPYKKGVNLNCHKLSLFKMAIS